MSSNILLNSIQQVYWFILVIFFVLVSLSWFIASKNWFKEDVIAAKPHEEQDEQAANYTDQ